MAEPDRPANPEPSLLAVVVTYFPDATVADNLRAVVAECRQAVVVDNGSDAATQEQLAAIPGVTLLRLVKNIGLAAALNLGAERALAMGARWIVTFDQDSRPQSGMVRALWTLHQRQPLAGVIGPCLLEPGNMDHPYRPVCAHPRWPFWFRRPQVDRDRDDVTMVITSGSLMELELWRQLGGFDSALFIDYVDIDYCLRVRQAGRKVAVAADAVLVHHLGHRQSAQVFGRDFRPMHHAAFRHYYMARNRMRMWRRHALAVPHWALFDFCFAGYNYSRVLLFEDQRWAKVKAIVRGTWHGLQGRSGPMPP